MNYQMDYQFMNQMDYQIVYQMDYQIVYQLDYQMAHQMDYQMDYCLKAITKSITKYAHLCIAVFLTN